MTLFFFDGGIETNHLLIYNRMGGERNDDISTKTQIVSFSSVEIISRQQQKIIKIDIVSRVNISQSLVLVNFETGQRGEREREKKRLLVECKSY